MKATHQGNQSLVLIVDNKEFNRQQLRLLVEQSGYRVVEAKDGTEAMNVFHQLHPDLVLLNAIMPDMDRFELCSMVQSIEENKHTPVLMITELEDTELIERVFQVSTMDYVTSRETYIPRMKFGGYKFRLRSTAANG